MLIPPHLSSARGCGAPGGLLPLTPRRHLCHLCRARLREGARTDPGGAYAPPPAAGAGEEKMKAMEEARRYLEDRLPPFQRHLAKQRRSAEQSLKQLEARVRPLRQYLEGQDQNLGRVSQHLNQELRDQFDTFGRYLSEQQRVLEMATRYLD